MREKRNRSRSYPATILVIAAIGAGGASAQERDKPAEKSAYDLGVASYKLAVEEAELRKQLEELEAATAKRQNELERKLVELADARARAKARSKVEHELRGKVDAAWASDLYQIFEAMPGAQGWRVGIQIDGGSKKGVTVAGTEKGSPAEKAGIQKGDVVAAVNGISIRGIPALQAIINAAGDQQLTLSLKRGKEKLDVKVTPQVADYPIPQVRAFPGGEAWDPEAWPRQFEHWRYQPAPGNANPPRVFEWRPQQRPAPGPNSAEIEALKNELEELRALVEEVVEGAGNEEEDDDEGSD